MKKALIILASLLILSCGSGDSDDDSNDGPPEIVYMDQFPISLDELFLVDQPAQQTAWLAGIESGRTEACNLRLHVYPNLFHLDHMPAAGKWYLYALRYSTVTLPAGGYFEINYYRSGDTEETINGSLHNINLKVTVYLSKDMYLAFDHINILSGIVDAYESSGTVNVFGNSRKALWIDDHTDIGSCMDDTALDFIVYDLSNDIFVQGSDATYINNMSNPLLYFTSDVQQDIISHYQMQLNEMKKSGLYIESSLNRSMNINRENTLFGTWYYDDGPFNLDSSHNYYRFQGSICNIMSVEDADSETFYKDANTGTDFGSDMIGVFGDQSNTDVTNYTTLGGRYIFYVSGDNQEGIVLLQHFFSSAESTADVYMKYRLIPDSSNIYEDKLQVEYFSTQAAAEGSFTSGMISYKRWGTYLD